MDDEERVSEASGYKALYVFDREALRDMIEDGGCDPDDPVFAGLEDEAALMIAEEYGDLIASDVGDLISRRMRNGEGEEE